MKAWNITYYSVSVEKDILSLPDTIVAKYIKLAELMTKFGANLGMPHTKALGDGLFELRLKGQEGIARVFYCTVIGNEIVMLHSFVKKTDKLPPRELKLARVRLKEIQNEKS